ncbi:hypothetical protein CVIRNUC_003787 [Coccomyxa viridis]|uniref:Uncharacterized protein n=1 Tax=Coccomyxa viridis TaxID=1274662 RepID=A0AAV1I2V2_9CHLO|nr:hypothetical protein CVIRNUC_003787 [Coccomyxa viridis]
MSAAPASSMCSTSGRKAAEISRSSCLFNRGIAPPCVQKTLRSAVLRTPSACQAVCKQAQQEQKRHIIRNTYPEPETEKERSSVDFPQEWMTPQPSRRPDVQPEFEKLEVPLPKKLPGDPDVPDEEEEEEEEKKKKNPDKDDPEKEKPDAPPEQE